MGKLVRPITSPKSCNKVVMPAIFASVVPVTFLEWGARTEDGETKMCLVWEPQPPEITDAGN